MFNEPGRFSLAGFSNLVDVQVTSAVLKADQTILFTNSKYMSSWLSQPLPCTLSWGWWEKAYMATKVAFHMYFCFLQEEKN